MKAFGYARPRDPADAVATARSHADAAFLAGGTDLVNLMKDGAAAPGLLVDLNHVGLASVTADERGLHLGALARMTGVAAHPEVLASCPVISQALLASASGQVRNMASIGGNLLQRTRCWYFRDPGLPCNTRTPGSGCPALEGENRMHAIFGGSEACIKVHPSDLAVALLAVDALILTRTPGGTRRIPVDDFYLLPGATPHRETVLGHADLITGVLVPREWLGCRSSYVKVSDRVSFDFALVSAAAAVTLTGGRVEDVRITLGGVAPRPWRARAAESVLRGQKMTEASIRAAAEAAVVGARPGKGNAFKVELLKRTVHRALTGLGGTR
jgi:xanthine dehydrogenase YagS FAD-binding subunit